MKIALTFSRRDPGFPYFLGFVSIAALWLGFPNDFYSLPPLVLIWPLSLALVGRRASSYFDALRAAWLVNWIGCLCALYWLYMPVSDVGGLPWPLALLCAAVIAFCVAAPGALFAVLARFMAAYPALPAAVALSVAWYLLELAFAVAAGFPWLSICGALAQWPLMLQAANIFGACLLGAIWLVPVFACYFALSAQTGVKRAFTLSGLIVACLLGYGAMQMSEYDARGPESAEIAAIMVEGNIDQNQKWIPQFQKTSLDIYIRLTNDAVRAADKEKLPKPLIIWPETALPFFFQRNADLAAATRHAIEQWDLPLLFGAPGVEKKGIEDVVFNRAFLLNPAGDVIGEYDKQHLVPFGEYLPKWLKFDFLEALLQGVGIYEEGSNPDPLRYENLALGLLICYEGIFPWLAQERVAHGANILVDISNDGWFGNSPAARQHLYLTAPRCIEQGRWLLRATNTGISAVIDPLGRPVLLGRQFVEEYLLCRARLEYEETIFHRFAERVPWMAMLLFGIMLLPGLFYTPLNKRRI